MSKKIVIIYFGDYWDDRWRRRQQLAMRLAQKHEIERVFYIEMPASIPELIKSLSGMAEQGVSERWKRILKHGLIYPLEKIEIVTPVSLLPYFGYRFNFDKTFVRFLTYRLLRNTIKQYSVTHKLILWVSHPFAADYIGKFNEDFVCYDCTEKFSEFEEWGTKLRETVEKNDIYITQKANLVFTQTTTVLLEKKKINQNTYLISNAVDYDNFSHICSPESYLSDIKAIRRPVLGFLGMYNNKIDGNLLTKVANTFPECSIVFLGINTRDGDFTILKNYNNVHYLGPKPFNQIPKYLQFLDVCLLPYKIEGNNRGGSPLKLFDYLASGNPIVSTKVSGTEEFGDVVTLAQNHEEFIDGIKSALSENDLSMQIKRKEKAKENSWEIKTDQIWSLIQKSLTEKQL